MPAYKRNIYFYYLLYSILCNFTTVKAWPVFPFYIVRYFLLETLKNKKSRGDDGRNSLSEIEVIKVEMV